MWKRRRERRRNHPRKKRKNEEKRFSPLHDSTLLGQTTRPFITLFFLGFLASLLSRRGLSRLLCRRAGSRSRVLGLRLGTTMQSLVVDLGDVLVESLTLSLGDRELKSSRLAGTIGTSEGTGTPGATSVDLLQVGQLTEGGLVTQRDVEETVVSEGAHGSNGSGLLTTTEGTGGDEKTGILAPVTTSGPDTTGLVPEGLPLGREVTIASRDTEQNGIVLQQSVGLSNGVAGLGGSVHLGQDLIG